MDPFSLEGRTAVVTGASRGIGAATARALDQAGAGRARGSVPPTALEATARGLRHDPVIAVADLLGDPGCRRPKSRERHSPSFGSVSVLVRKKQRAAAAARMATVDTDATLIDEVLAVNVRAPLLLIAAVVPAMVERGGGSIINLSSVSALVGTPRRAAYAASKGGLDAATRSLAIELGPSGIRVNAVAPGVVDTDLWAKNKAIPGVVGTIEGQTPLRRWATAEDIADVIVFLASDAARFVTGETISVDGGMAPPPRPVRRASVN